MVKEAIDVYIQGELWPKAKRCAAEMAPKYVTILILNLFCVGGAVASWLMFLSVDRAVWVPVLAADIVLCSRARHFTLTVPVYPSV